MEYGLLIAIGMIASFTIFGIIALKKTKYTGMKSNSEYYNLRKQEDPECRSYTNHSY